MKKDIHDGQIVRDLIKRSGIKLSVLAEMVGADTSTVCRWYAKPTLNKSIIQKVCKALNEPIESYFPHLHHTPELELTREIDSIRVEKIKLMEQLNSLQQKVVDLTEEKMNMKDEIILLKNKIIDLTEDLKEKSRAKK